MLSREESRERLLEFVDVNTVTNLQKRVAKLPKKLRAIAQGYSLYLSQSDNEYAAVIDETRGYRSKVSFEVGHWRKIGLELEQLNSKDKQTIFETLFPQFPLAAQGAWELKKTLPYQQGYSRKSFRFKASHPIQVEAASTYLRTLLTITLSCSEDINWFATWAAYLQNSFSLAPLFAAAINLEGTEDSDTSKVYDILYASLVGDHEIAAMGRHVVSAFMICEKEDAWIAIEKTLLAAQRQEGLRQSILSHVDESHPEAFKRMLRLIAEHNLSRFAASVTSVNVWFGFNFETGKSKQLDALLLQVADYFEDDLKRNQALEEGTGEELFLALWTIAYHDVDEAIKVAETYLQVEDIERRFAAAHLVRMLGTKYGQQALYPLLHDSSLRVAVTALDSFSQIDGSYKHLPNYFEELEKFFSSLPSSKMKTLKPIIWPWNERVLKREQIVNQLFHVLEDRPVTRLMPYLGDMDSYGRGRVIRLLATKAKETHYSDTSHRDALLHFVSDRNSSVSETAIKEVAKFGLRPEDVGLMEGLLTRKTASLRRSILTLLLTQEDAAVFDSIERLTLSKKAPLRFAGLELLSELKLADREVEKTKAITKAYQESKGDGLNTEEQTIVDVILESEAEKPTREDGFGLFDPKNIEQILPTDLPIASQVQAQLQAQKPTLLTKVKKQNDIPDVDDFASTVSKLPEQDSGVLKSVVSQFISQVTEGAKQLKGALTSAESSGPNTKENNFQLEHDIKLKNSSTAALIAELDAFIHIYRETPMQERYSKQETLLGNVRYLPIVQPKAKQKGQPYLYDDSGFETLQEAWQEIPLWEKWQAWWDAKQEAKQLTNEEVAFDALLAVNSLEFSYWRNYNSGNSYYNQHTDSDWPVLVDVYGNDIYEQQQLNYLNVVKPLLSWFFLLEASKRLEPTVDFLLDATEVGLGIRLEHYNQWWAVESKRREKEAVKDSDGFNRTNYRRFGFYTGYITQLNQLRLHSFGLWNESQQKRYFNMYRLLISHEAYSDMSKDNAEFQNVMFAWQKDWVSDDYVYSCFVGESKDSRSKFNIRYFTGLSQNKVVTHYPNIQEVVERCRDRIVEVELARADLPTEASPLAMQIRTIYGADKALYILKSLDRNGLVRGYTWGGGQNKGDVFSRLLRGSYPSKEDTAESFAKQAKELKLKEQRLIDLAVYAPQWASFVEETLSWKGFVDAVYWLHAHTKDGGWSVDAEIRNSWTAQVSERTPLSAKELLDGAVDVTWFMRVYKTLGEKRWTSIDAAAKYGSSSGGHKRAQLFADALLAELEVDACIDRLQMKRHQDSVRALGLIPLPKAKKAAKAELLARYEVIQQFVHGSRKFGSQRKASERLCADVGLANLARTAGYQDPQRLMWAMEAEACADLAKGPISVTEAETTVSLYIDDDAKVQLDVVKVVKGKEKKLKAIPAKLKKHPEISILRERKTELTKQTSRMRISLEESMIRGDSFTSTEFIELCDHPLLKAMLTDLLFITEDGAMGFPIKNGKSLEVYDGSEIQLGKTVLRIAHPYDLLQNGHWTEWQKNCFDVERKQSFKQIFRELYVCSDAEQKTPLYSKRYEGHQVESRQAVGILGKRSWVSVHEEGLRKSFHSEGISAWVYFDNFYFTAGESDGLTVDTVAFAKRDERGLLPLEDVPPRLFSEVMRDLDLMVSVAHRGGVDPEASASTVEMRENLLRETLQLLKVENVRLENTHALIKGELGSYSVHLGSANVHRQPGGYVCIIPVHSQHRGRIFLPFADDDPKTAEVISKVIMLAKDKDIKDPTILEQLL